MHRLVRRLVQLYAGLVLFGVSLALMVLAHLGLDSWDVLHQGLAGHLGWQIGTVAIAVGLLVLVAWIPLRQRPGIGTLSNAVVVGLVTNATLALTSAPQPLVARGVLLAAAIVLNAIATGMYIGANLGPGPRDGLMTALARQGRSIRSVRTAIELTVLALGWVIGGSVGVGTVAFAVTIGPLVHWFLPRFSVPGAEPLGAS